MPVSSSGSPAVTVLMAIHNAAMYLRESMDSILSQTFTDFEFLIYNDGSTDESAAIIKSFADERVILVDNPLNRGVSPNMNEGIERARGHYIVRMDGDDLADPTRIAKQVAYMDAHPEVGLCGTAVRYFGASDALIQLPEDNATIQQTMWLQNSFYQPSVIIRTSVLRDNNLRYNVAFDPAEDYKLWSDMCAVTQVHNLPEPLLKYRIHPHQISRRQNLKQQRSSAQTRREQMHRLGIELQPEQEVTFELLTVGDDWPTLTPPDYRRLAALLRDLGEQARQTGIAPATVYRVLSQQWGKILGAARHYRPALLPFVWQRPFWRYLPPVMLAKLALKCLIGWRVKPAG